MVVLETAALLGGPYAQGAPALKMVQKRYIGLHQWLGPLRSKELKEQIVSGGSYVNVCTRWELFSELLFLRDGGECECMYIHMCKVCARCCENFWK